MSCYGWTWVGIGRCWWLWSLGSGVNRPLVTDEPVEFEKWVVEDGYFRRITDYFRWVCRIHLKWMNRSKTGRWCLTCNQLDLESLGCWLTICAQTLPGHWFWLVAHSAHLLACPSEGTNTLNLLAEYNRRCIACPCPPPDDWHWHWHRHQLMSGIWLS